MQKVIVDVRDGRSYKMNHLYNAVNIPYDKLMNDYKDLLTKENDYYFYCDNGIQSKKIAVFLKANGYNTNVIK